MLAAVRELGLESRRNISVPRGLKALAGFGARRYAVIDVGTNSVKFHVGEREADGAWRTLVDRAEVTRLGEGLDETGALGDGADRRGRSTAIAGMVDEARRDGVEEIAAVGTAGLRIAANSADVRRGRPRAHAASRSRSISGEEEAPARLPRGDVPGSALARGSLVVFDTGGGSSQFTFGHGERVDERFSVDVGAVRFTERFGLDEAVSSDDARRRRSRRSRPTSRGSTAGRAPDALVGMGGAVTNLAAVKLAARDLRPDVVQGTVLDRAEIDRQIELYRTRDADERREIVGLQPKRAEVILAGACIVRTVLDEARPRLADGQRPRPAPRPARRALRAVGVRRARAGASARRSSEAAPSPVREPPRT